MRKVYLAGGMHSNWREIVMKVAGFSFIDPRDHQLSEDAELYTLWDIPAW